MLLTFHDPVEVIKIANWNDQKPEFGQYVEVGDGNGDSGYRYTIGRELLENGSLPRPGEHVYLTLESYRRPEARRGQNGDYVKWEQKYRFVAFKPAQAAAKAA